MLLRRNPGLQSKVARTLDVSEGLVSRVWWGKAKSARILTAILRKVLAMTDEAKQYPVGKADLSVRDYQGGETMTSQALGGPYGGR